MTQSRPRTTISTPTVIVSIFWSPVDFPVIITLLPRVKCSADYFYGDIIPLIVKRMLFDLATSPRNRSPHRARESVSCLGRFRIRLIDHPPYSSDLTPSGFYLFGKLKEALAGENSTQSNNSSRQSGKSLAVSDMTSSNQFLTRGRED
jgi:hypothetical protein